MNYVDKVEGWYRSFRTLLNLHIIYCRYSSSSIFNINKSTIYSLFSPTATAMAAKLSKLFKLVELCSRITSIIATI